MADDRLAILGAGVMGTGIAALAIGHAIPVVLVDLHQGVLDRATDSIAGQLRHAQLLGALPDGVDRGRLTTSTTPRSVHDATVVIEAITEDPAGKGKLLAEVSAIIQPGTPLVTNTSGIPVDDLAESVDRPEELVGVHFMNPAYLIKQAEVIRGPRTGDAVLDQVTALLGRLNRRAVVVRDAPGFVTSRLLHPMINDAARIVQAGTADVAEVDELMQGCLGHPAGPLRTADLIGLDNLADALRVLAARTGISHYAPCELLLSKVAADHLGRKSGKGFYDYREVLS
jgi:methoxymalonate biosynthesis protein